MKKIILALLLVCGFLPHCARAQWQDETFVLKPGWNAVYLHIDASYETLDNLITGTANKIGEVWLWNPALSPDRFISDPQTPVVGSDWLHWDRNPAIADTFNRFIPNTAYLVRNTNTTDYAWTLRGKPAPPRYNWTSSGVNLIGFSVPAVGPVFANFLLPAQELANGGEFYRYSDGNNDLSPSKFNGVFNFLRVQRGEAYWVKWPDHFNTYFGALKVSLQNSDGIRFNELLSTHTLTIQNNLATQTTVTLALRSSLTPPTGQQAVAGNAPLLRRGDLDTTTLTYPYTTFAAPQTITLAAAGQPGSAMEIVLGLNRSAMTAAAGSLYAGVLRVTDSSGYSQIDLPVSATVASNAGLWIGDATVTHVQHYIKNYERDPDGKPLLGTNGISYAVTNVNTSFGPAASPYPLRLIVHNGTNGITRLYQQIYNGIDRGSNTVLAIAESILDPKTLASARRISAAHLPWTSGNAGWTFAGTFSQGNTLTTTVTVLNNDQASNPFLHTYHPDHDNLNATFDAVEPRGVESYDVVRNIALEILPPSLDFAGLTDASSHLVGNYAESITFKGSGTEQRVIYTKGSFKLTRISGIEQVKTTP
jgi:hypothetical protein